MSIVTNQFVKQKISDIINLDSFIPDENIIISKPDSDDDYIGCVYEMSPLPGTGQDVSTILTSILKTAPDRAILQVSLLCQPNFEASDIYRKNKTEGGDLIQELITRRDKLLQSASKIGFQHDLPIINKKRLIISYMHPASKIDGELIEEEKVLQEGFLINLKAAGFVSAQRLSPQKILGLYPVFANAFEKDRAVNLDSMQELKYQSFGPDDYIDFRDVDCTKVNQNHFFTTVAIKTYPPFANHSLMNLVIGAPFNVGETSLGGGQRLLNPFAITTTIRLANQSKELSRISGAIASRVSSELSAFNAFAFAHEAKKDKVDDLAYLLENCGPEKDRLVFVSTTACVFSDSRSNAINASMVFKSTLVKLGFDARIAGTNAEIRWSQALPLNFSITIAEELECETLITAAGASCFIPIYSDYVGNGVTSEYSGSMFFSRRGAPYFLDIFTTNNNYSGLICAQAGGGKSFLIQQMAVDQLAQGNRVIILDRGRSTEKLTRAVGGQFIEFSGKSQNLISLNPFIGIDDKTFETQSAVITDLMLLMAGASKDDKSALQNMDAAVKTAWGTNNTNTKISDVIAILKNTADSTTKEDANTDQKKCKELCGNMDFFWKDPYRSSFFKGTAGIDPNNKLLVFEIGDLDNDLELKNVVMTYIMYVIRSQTNKLPGNKILIVDEAFDLLNHPMSADVVSGFYQKGRKDGLSTWVVVQSLLELFKTPKGHFIFSQCAWRMILSQKQEEVDKLFTDGLLTQFSSDPYFQRLMGSIKTQKPLFSEVMIISEVGYDAVRLYVDNFTSAMFNSEQKQRELFFHLFESLPDKDDPSSVIGILDSFIGDKSRVRKGLMKSNIDFLMREEGMTLEEVKALHKEIVKKIN